MVVSALILLPGRLRQEADKLEVSLGAWSEELKKEIYLYHRHRRVEFITRCFVLTAASPDGIGLKKEWTVRFQRSLPINRHKLERLSSFLLYNMVAML